MTIHVLGSLHTGLHVADLERSLAFYVDLLGCTLRGRRVVDAPYVQELVGYPGAELHQAFVGIPGSQHALELIEYREVEKTAIDPRNADPGTAHLCLLVDDVAAVCVRLRAAGVELVSDPVVPTEGPNVGRPAVYVKDPDGIRVELLQVAADARSPASSAAPPPRPTSPPASSGRRARSSDPRARPAAE